MEHTELVKHIRDEFKKIALMEGDLLEQIRAMREILGVWRLSMKKMERILTGVYKVAANELGEDLSVKNKPIEPEQFSEEDGPLGVLPTDSLSH